MRSGSAPFSWWRSCPGPLLIALSVSAILIAVSAPAHAERLAAAHGEGPRMPAKTIDEALRAHTDRLMAIPGVVGVAQGVSAGRPSIVVFVAERTHELQQRIPKTLDGYPVVVEATGEIRPRPEDR